MQLFSSNGNDIPNAEFATLSLLGNQQQGPSSCCIVVVSPLITTSSSLSQNTIVELHEHLELIGSHSDFENKTAIQKHENSKQVSVATPHTSTSDPTDNSNHSKALENETSSSSRKDPLLHNPEEQQNMQNDENKPHVEQGLISQLFQQQYNRLPKNSNFVQKYHPSCAGGRITLFYKVLSNISSSTMNALFGVDTSTNGNCFVDSKPLLCVGVIGDYSLLYPELKDSMLHFEEWLENYNGDQDLATLLTTALTSLLLDDESIRVAGPLDSIKNNDMSSSENAGGMMMMSIKNSANNMDGKLIKSKSFYPKSSSNNVARVLFMKKRKTKSNLKNKDWNHERASFTTSLKSCLTASSSSFLPSSDIARIIADQLQVLSLAENDMINLRGYTSNDPNTNANSKNYPHYRKKGVNPIRSPSRISRKNINNHNQQSKQQLQSQHFGQSQQVQSHQQPQRSSGEGSDLSGFDYHPPYYYCQQNNYHDVLQSGSGSGTIVDDLSVQKGTSTTASLSSISRNDDASLSGDSLTAFSVRSFTSVRSSASSFSSASNMNSSHFNSSSIVIPTLVGPTRDSDISKKDFRKNRILAASQRKQNQQHSFALNHYNNNKLKYQHHQNNNNNDNSQTHLQNSSNGNINSNARKNNLLSYSPRRDSRTQKIKEYDNKSSAIPQAGWPNLEQGSSTSIPPSLSSNSSPTSKIEINQSGTIFNPFSFQDEKVTAQSPSSPSRNTQSSYSRNDVNDGAHHPSLSVSGYNGNNNLAVYKKAHKSQDITDKSSNTNSYHENSWLSPRSQKVSGLIEKEQPEVMLNIALNEDLTCSYRNSKLSTCSIEGIIQIQIKSETNHHIPFALSIYDRLNHIKTIQENKKYVEDITADINLCGHGNSNIIHERQNVEATYKYIVTVTEAEQYFPILRYKCSSELRPVPIRVQTRVRVHDRFCRVALQISSNPANDDDLTDLTIIMVVPPIIKGESLTTSPAGGVWNEERRSVVWCVAELGIGQKFQLQAQFEMKKKIDTNLGDQELPTFPVLVRCQCMFTQLSSIGIDASSIPAIYPSKLTMQMAKRARISHKER